MVRVSNCSADTRRFVGSRLVEKTLPGVCYCSSKERILFHEYKSRCSRKFRLGRTLLKRRVLSGRVAPQGDDLAHQQEGAGVGLQVSGLHDAGGGLCEHVPGFQNSSGFHQQDGRNKILCTVQHSSQSLEAGAGKEGVDQSKLVAKGDEPSCGYALQVSNRYLGGCPVHSVCSSSGQQVVPAINGHVCKQAVSCHCKVL